MVRTARRLRRAAGLSRLDRQDGDGALLGLLTLLLLILIDLCYHRRTSLSGTFVIAPVLAAGLAQPAVVVGVGVVSLGASIGMSNYDLAFSGLPVRLSVVVAGTLIGVFTARHRRVIYARAVRLKSIAEAAESALLRPLPGRVGPASMSGWHVAATREASVGGDFYEAVPYGARARWVIGDARGHGVEAIRLGAAVIGAFREAASRLESIEEVAERVEESLSGFLGEEDFVTAVFADLSQDGTLQVINCGHPLPCYLGDFDASELALPGTTPLGIEPDLTATSIQLSSGQSLCFWTDGLDEVQTARARGVDPAGLRAGLGHFSADEAAQLIRGRLATAVPGDRFGDDVSVVVVKYEPLADVSRPRLRVVQGGEIDLGANQPSSGLL